MQNVTAGGLLVANEFGRRSNQRCNCSLVARAGTVGTLAYAGRHTNTASGKGWEDDRSAMFDTEHKNDETVYTARMATDQRRRRVGKAASPPLKTRAHPTAPAPHNPRQNHLLGALPKGDFERLASQLELVPMKLGDVLYESGAKLRYVFFPTTSIISLLYVMADGASAEIAIVGNEGILGISLFMGGESTPSRAIVQSAGHAFRIKSESLKSEFARFGPTMHLLLRYTQALITQMSQTAVCNRHHSVDQQLCRWLLLSLDRLTSNELSMTQELIANMLGVRREGVTEAAGKLQDAGLIRYQRGKIIVLDRLGLEARSCECYQVVKTEFDRLLPTVAR